MRVLIADDDIHVLRGLKILIPWEELGAELVGEARNGEDAFHMAIEKSPDIIISDIKMPVMDGLELCKRLHAATIDTSIILLSAYKDFDYARTAMKYGVKSYIVKPIDREKIGQLIDEIASIREDYDNKLALYQNIIQNEDLENYLSDSLSNSGKNFMEWLNSEENRHMKSKEFFLKLVDILYAYFKKIGVNPESVMNSRENTIKKLYSLKTIENMEAYVEQLYYGVLQFTSEKKDSRTEHIVNCVKDYIDRNYSDPNLSVSEIADNLQLTPAYLSVIFRQFSGDNIISYMKAKRYDKACELLKDPTLPMSDVAVFSGFQNQHYFAKAFKKQAGMTPSEYRNLSLK